MRGKKPLSRHEYFEATISRFWRDVQRRGANECWPWVGQLGKPSRVNMLYGRFAMLSDGKTKSYRSHRFVWMLMRGPIPDGMNVLHRCDNTKCCNPEHLFLGSQHDNIEDMKRKNRQARGENNVKAKLTEADVREIRASTETTSALAKRYGVHYTTMVKVRDGRFWSHVN